MYQLTSSLPFLLARLGVRMGALFSQRLARYGLTLPMYRVLAALTERPDQKLNELSALTAVELSTMSRLIGTMISMGLVSRERLPTNERTVCINLTEKGVEMAALLRVEAEHYEEVAISVLKPSEVTRMKTNLARIYDELDVLEAELVANAPSASRA
jgi:DNA-binding MarR family transcriptional regulator